MRTIVIKILATMASFYAARYLVAGFHLDSTLTAFLTTSIIFLLFNLLVSPLVKLLLLPVNLLTLGIFRWVASVLVLYLFDLFYAGLRISAYNFQGFSSGLVALPAAHLSLFWVLVLCSFIMSLTYSLVTSLFSAE